MSKDTYKVVTDRIIEALEQGIVPWAKPWKSIGGGQMSLSTGKPYRGMNVFILEATAAIRGYSCPWWATFKQAKEAAVAAARREGREIIEKKGRKGTYYVEIIDGVETMFRGGVRKDEKGTPVVLWKPVAKKGVDENGEEQNGQYMLLRSFTVFNLEQCDGIEPPAMPEVEEHDPIETAEAISIRYTANDGPRLRHGGDEAFYMPAADIVSMPLLGQFDTAEHYYGTLFHELAHSTGHDSRLARPGIVAIGPFGSEEYSREELVAELAAAFLCGEAGIEPNVQHHAGYVQSWLKALEGDRKMIVQAASQAQRAADLIVGRTKEEASSDAPRSITTRRNHAQHYRRRNRPWNDVAQRRNRHRRIHA